jgi:hypothetical protein
MEKHKHAEMIKEHADRLTYVDGALYWADNYGPRSRKGAQAGCKDTHGYFQIKLDDVMVLAHRIIWFKHYGTFPAQVDHINRIRWDNRIENLRESNNLLNAQNNSIRRDNTSGFQGVHMRSDNRWIARISANNKRHDLGSFDSPEEASLAYQAAKKKFHPHSMT